jgi:hypothetical protein
MINNIYMRVSLYFTVSIIVALIGMNIQVGRSARRMELISEASKKFIEIEQLVTNEGLLSEQDSLLTREKLESLMRSKSIEVSTGSNPFPGFLPPGRYVWHDVVNHRGDVLLRADFTDRYDSYYPGIRANGLFYQIRVSSIKEK